MVPDPRQVNRQGRWLHGCLLLFCAGCAQAPQNPASSPQAQRAFYAQVEPVKALVQNGDLVFRNGTDEVSRASRSMNRVDTSFSHCGIILVENDSIMVYHAIGGHYNPSQKLKRESLDSFLVPGESDRFAVFRYPLNAEQNDSLTRLVRGHYRSGLRFDLFFNFLSDDEMYCSEFVYKCLNRALSNALGTMIQAREWPFGITPDDLYLNEKSILVKRVDFYPAN